MAYLLIHGTLPNQQILEKYRAVLRNQRAISQDITALRAANTTNQPSYGHAANYLLLSGLRQTTTCNGQRQRAGSRSTARAFRWNHRLLASVSR